jgi:hypothetical protein
MDECWPWTAATFFDGTGMFTAAYETLRANRVAYELAFGPIPGGAQVRHACGNTGCVNPQHLVLRLKSHTV